jgi:hypothetical protein
VRAAFFAQNFRLLNHLFTEVLGSKAQLADAPVAAVSRA